MDELGVAIIGLPPLVFGVAILWNRSGLGANLARGKLYADVPIWRKDPPKPNPEEVRFHRWMLGGLLTIIGLVLELTAVRYAI